MIHKRGWFKVYTYKGYEKKVKSNLELRIKKYNLENKITDIVVPPYEISLENYPGFILVKMINKIEIQYVIKNTPGVIAFTENGQRWKYKPLTRREIFELNLKQ